MSELIFGPSADWLPLSGIESLQPRLDGGFDLPKRKKIVKYIVKQVVIDNHPKLFDEQDEYSGTTDEYPEQSLF